MEYSIKQENRRVVAGFHMVGPWEQTVKQGFEQLAMWVNGQKIPAKEWVAVYYDNPDEVPAEKLRCDTVVTVGEGFTPPANSERVIVTEVAAGTYAKAPARVLEYDFSTPWLQFFNSMLEDKDYELDARPCFEIYLNDGNQDGHWDIEMYIPVKKRAF
jgi:DNA gyrase inhibitor